MHAKEQTHHKSATQQTDTHNYVRGSCRPGTSLKRPTTSAAGSGPDASTRPMTNAGRPITGFARPGTSSRPQSGAVSVGDAFKGNRPGTSRPATSLGRQVRLGTASMRSEVGGPFINVDKLDLKRYATLPAVAKVGWAAPHLPPRWLFGGSALRSSTHAPRLC